MELLTANRYYASDDRAIHVFPFCVPQGEIDMSATTAEFASTPASHTNGDADVVDLLGSETEVEIFVADTIKTIQGGACSSTWIWHCLI